MNYRQFHKISIMSYCTPFGFIELQIWLIYSAIACVSRIVENTWMLGYFACLLLSVIHVLGDEVSTPEAL
jgi:hypothetical protein